MSARLAGKVAFVTGVARGQGRSHAIRLAEEGADIIGVDLPRPVENMTYPLATQEDLDETVRLVEKTGRSIVVRTADVRDRPALDEAVAAGVEEFGHLDVVVANAGVCPLGQTPPNTFLDVVDVNLVGVLNTFNAAYPHLRDGASLIGIGSVAGLTPGSVDNPATGPGGAGYGFSKRAIAQLVHDFAILVASRGIRVNAVHPTNVDTDMLQNDGMYRMFRPDLESPGKEDAALAFPVLNAIPVPWVDPVDVSNAIVYLASDESRFVTGSQLKVDAGAIAKALPL
ncbi:mycofactocin-coupled SDR family oxidoreductase [Gordonia sp. zg691]|uniref:Mycofactocin-coupled SDR family oxidoreductase n=1 Tax=Gordonia jinghuaiqii TaxID=2758710 RepID=A0A7D7QWI5_9ACTN|nr:mycofactocin-coupled SDR family oxidoreductase [Gordonia jinghuaiqii]MBD0863568.1 mycofactocin-coupled SDR family oxidoreductase [Gordonia jinghuaiqii]MCR5979304.1 mycofactocin-coupled SDR family oxidoreductase [Gordonia jinghuaiqii]QMT01089.1 mycofactocin-coupled SDR family oxidoreductase [Gordonia jinghuaiqii]